MGPASENDGAHSIPSLSHWRDRLVLCCATSLLIFSTSLCAAESAIPSTLSERVYSSTGKMPAKLAVFADCVARERVFGKVEQGLYYIDLPAGTSCTVLVGERGWDSLPLQVDDPSVAVALPFLVYPREIPEPELAIELVQMGTADQALRGKNWRQNDPNFLNRAQAEDGARQHRLGEIIAAKGWPTLSMVGWEAANAAWLIAQHAPTPRLKSWLVLMNQASLRHEIALYNLATSIDRVLVHDDRHQLYGTQYRLLANGASCPYPTEDMDHLDHRRLTMGLPRNVLAQVAECFDELRFIQKLPSG